MSSLLAWLSLICIECSYKEMWMQLTGNVIYGHLPCRFVFVLEGTMNVNVPSAKAVKVLHADNYAFIPADSQHVLSSDDGAGLLLFERRCVVSGQYCSLHRSIIRTSQSLAYTNL